MTLCYDQISDYTATYKTYKKDETRELSREDLTRLLSLRLSALEEVEFSRKSYSSAASELIKMLKADIKTINDELKSRPISVGNNQKEGIINV